MPTPVSLPVTTVTRSGIAPAAEQNGDATNGHYFSNSGHVIVLVRNADTNPHTVTFVTPGTVDTLAVADLAVVVPASVSRYIGPFPPGTYSDQSGNVNITVDSSQLKLSAYTI